MEKRSVARTTHTSLDMFVALGDKRRGWEALWITNAVVNMVHDDESTVDPQSPLPEPVRPRYGRITRADGSSEPLVFVPTEDPLVFLGLLASDQSPVNFRPGDDLEIDVIGPKQSVIFDVRLR